MFPGPFVVLFVLLTFVATMQLDENSTCSGLGCQNTVTMQLLDKMEGNLKADFDVSEMNKLLKVCIDQEIRSVVEIVLQQVKQGKGFINFLFFSGSKIFRGVTFFELIGLLRQCTY